jgi:hypothetical protein
MFFFRSQRCSSNAQVSLALPCHITAAALLPITIISISISVHIKSTNRLSIPAIFNSFTSLGKQRTYPPFRHRPIPRNLPYPPELLIPEFSLRDQAPSLRSPSSSFAWFVLKVNPSSLGLQKTNIPSCRHPSSILYCLRSLSSGYPPVIINGMSLFSLACDKIHYDMTPTNFTHAIDMRRCSAWQVRARRHSHHGPASGWPNDEHSSPDSQTRFAHVSTPHPHFAREPAFHLVHVARLRVCRFGPIHGTLHSFVRVI